MTRPSELNAWRGVAIACLLLIAVVAVRAATRSPGGSVVVGDPSGGAVELGRFTCKGPNGNAHGTCADNWWESFWHGISYCSDLESACKAAGGLWTREEI